MDEILVINAGSSSVKTTLFELKDGRLKVKEGKPTNLIAIGYRVVHGGSKFSNSVLINQSVLKEIEDLCLLAPLHNPVALKQIEETAQKNIPQVAVFDTAFFFDLPLVEQTYAIPYQLAEKHQIRRYGFHGIAHQSMYQVWKETQQGQKVITLQLGSGCSMSAISRDLPLATSMGFTPLEGLVMASRGGDIDPGLIEYLLRKENLSLDELSTLLNKKSGLLGISGESNDMRELLASSSERAKLAIDCFCQKIIHYIGAYSALLQGYDALIFSGGIGENSFEIRKRILDHLKITYSPEANLAACDLSAGDLRVLGKNVFVVGSYENQFIAEETLKVINATK